jgi:hypothetical protein
MEVLADRKLLQKYMPPAWKSCAEMAGAVAILLTANSCLAQPQDPKLGKAGAAAVVAPIFEHGEGRGAIGCVVVNAPVFLSEQDAMQVIREELRRSGVTLSDNNVPLSDVTIAQREEHWSVTKGKPDISTGTIGKSKPLVLQGLDPKKRVGIEVVYSEDYFDLGGARSSSTVQGYDFKAVAKEVRDQVASKGHDLYLGTFYDPAAANDDFRHEDPEFRNKLQSLYAEYEKIKEPAMKEAKQKEIDALYEHHLDPIKEESRRLLRMQIKDFVDWLKAQGAI